MSNRHPAPRRDFDLDEDDRRGIRWKMEVSGFKLPHYVLAGLIAIFGTWAGIKPASKGIDKEEVAEIVRDSERGMLAEIDKRIDPLNARMTAAEKELVATTQRLDDYEEMTEPETTNRRPARQFGKP